MKRYLRLPFSATPLILVASFTICLLLAVKAGFAGIALALVVTSSFLKYCFVVFDAVAAGDEELPVLSVEMINPVDEQRPLALGLLIAAQCMLVASLHTRVGPVASLLVGSIFVFTLPASIAVLGITRNAFRSVSPYEITSLIRGLGTSYVLLDVVLLAGAAAVSWMLTQDGPLWATFALPQVFLLFLATMIGGAVFEHRLELGIETRTREERRQEREQREHVAERRQMLDRSYALFRVRKPLEGWQEMETWLSRYGDQEVRLREHRALLEAACTWDDSRPADRLANDLIAQLLARRATGEALGVVETRLRDNPQFALAQASHAVRLAELARAAGKPALARTLRSGEPG